MKQTENRREFLKKISAAALFLPAFGAAACSPVGQAAMTKAQRDLLESIRRNAIRDPNCNWCGAIDFPADVQWQTRLADLSEKGDPLVISGTVFLPDGKTPAPGVLIYAYHTDTEGLYGRAGDESGHGRFRGWMLTDERGGYRFRTIKPAPYPSRKTPAHIHYTLTGKTFREDWIDTLFFAGDDLITDEIRRQQTGKGGFDSFVKLEKNSDGILSGTRDIRLEKSWVKSDEPADRPVAWAQTRSISAA